MRYCTNCRISITGNSRYCPLCQSETVLQGKVEPSPYPYIIPDTKTRSFFIKLLLFLSIATSFVCVLINLLYPKPGAWCIFVLAGIACMWVTLWIALRKGRILLKNITWQTFVISVLVVLWDDLTGWHLWSINYVLPLLFTVTMILIPLIALIMHIPQRGYLVYFCLVGFLGLIPAIFLLTGLCTVPVPSAISVCVSVVFLIAVAVFMTHNLREELRRRFHL